MIESSWKVFSVLPVLLPVSPQDSGGSRKHWLNEFEEKERQRLVLRHLSYAVSKGFGGGRASPQYSQTVAHPQQPGPNWLMINK